MADPQTGFEWFDAIWGLFGLPFAWLWNRGSNQAKEIAAVRKHVDDKLSAMQVEHEQAVSDLEKEFTTQRIREAETAVEIKNIKRRLDSLDVKMDKLLEHFQDRG